MGAIRGNFVRHEKFPHNMRLNPKLDYSDWNINPVPRFKNTYAIDSNNNILRLSKKGEIIENNWSGQDSFIEKYFIPAVIVDWQGEFNGI